MDDWTDGVGKSPQQFYDALTSPDKPTMKNMPPSALDDADKNISDNDTTSTTTTSGTSGTTSTSAAAGAPGEVGTSDLLGGDAGDVVYPYYLINGESPRPPPHSIPSRANGSGFASSTVARTPHFAWRWPGIR